MHSDIYNLHREKHYLKLAQTLAAGIRSLILLLILAGIRAVLGHSVGWGRWLLAFYFVLEFLVLFADEIEYSYKRVIQIYPHLFRRLVLPFDEMDEMKRKELEELEKREKKKSEEIKKKDK
jgi:hypothetical protein